MKSSREDRGAWRRRSISGPAIPDGVPRVRGRVAVPSVRGGRVVGEGTPLGEGGPSAAGGRRRVAGPGAVRSGLLRRGRRSNLAEPAEVDTASLRVRARRPDPKA